MTNKEVMQRLSQTSGAYINKLIWIAGSGENDSEIKDFLEDVEASFYKSYMPEIFRSAYLSEYMDDPVEALMDFEYYGFLAEVHLPKASGFSFENGAPSSWQINPGYCNVERIYAESLTDLISIVERLASERFEKAAANELLKTLTPNNNGKDNN